MNASRTPLGEYLRARRALVSPEDVGLPIVSRRRVAGLRRDEVALLADVSAGYYLRLEQGHDTRPSTQVLQALGRALQLDDAAVEYMTRLVRLQSDGRPTSDSDGFPAAMDMSMRALFSQWKHTPAYLMDGNQDVVLSNDLARAMAPGALEPGVNLPQLVFSPAARAADPYWEETAIRTVATLRYGSDPNDPRLHEIVGRLYLNDPDFRRLWARHDARPHYVGPIDQMIPPFGAVSLTCQTFVVPGTKGHVLVVFHAQAGSRAASAVEALRQRVSRVEQDAALAPERSAAGSAVLAPERSVA